jgi:triphosphoribosyl-dephospho-CoA synthase
VSSIGSWVQTACVWEVTARKLGDVNPKHDLDTLKFADFIEAATAFAPAFDAAPQRRVGETVLEAVRLMRHAVNTNTHLGTILLLAPLAAENFEVDLTDARLVYQAIRLAQPSGLGQTPEQDVAGEPTLPLRQVMALAAERDLIARQYANGFADVFDLGVPALCSGLETTSSVEGAILFCQLTWLANHPDSLIARKLGQATADEASRRACGILDLGWPNTPAAWTAWSQLDRWLRAEPGRNPGTTADLVAASLFVTLRSGILTVDPALPWACDLVP